MTDSAEHLDTMTRQLEALQTSLSDAKAERISVNVRLGSLRSHFAKPEGAVPNGSQNSGDPTSFYHCLTEAWALNSGAVDQAIVAKIIAILSPLVEEKIGKQAAKIKDLTIMHLAAFVDLPDLMAILVQREEYVGQINSMDSEAQTPLHLACLTGSLGVVKFMHDHEDQILRADLEDGTQQTAFEIADEMGRDEIVKLLLTRPDVKDYLQKRRSERTMYGDGTNAILVGAALIASITFAGWLQPPLGYQKYYQYPRNSTMPGAPQDDYQQYAAISEHLSVKVFWVANSLSFYFAIAAILTGAGAMVPCRLLGELAEVKRKQGAAYLTGFVFSWAVTFVVVAFTAAGWAALPPGLTYASYMISTLVVGCFFCIYSFSTVRVSDPSFFLKHLELADPAFYFSKLSKLIEKCCEPFGYYSFEARTRERKQRYKPEPPKEDRQEACVAPPPKRCRWALNP